LAAGLAFGLAYRQAHWGRCCLADPAFCEVCPDKGWCWVRSQKLIFAVGIWFALLTFYVYSQENSDTFAIYLIAMALWIGLFAYCVRNRRKRPQEAVATPAAGQASLRGTASL
jgi:hypothetical protein